MLPICIRHDAPLAEYVASRQLAKHENIQSMY